MPIYDFNFHESADGRKLTTTQFDPMGKDKIERKPAIAQRIEKNVEKRNHLWFDPLDRNTAEENNDILPQGYRTIDRGIKNYFSGIRIPTKDGINLLQVRISGGDKPYLIWGQDLKRGRVVLPVMSIKREREEQYIEKFSPPYHYFSKRFLDKDLTRIALSYRPIPVKVTYSLSIWAEFKRDLEYAIYQIRSRFNPLAETYVEDEYNKMSLIMHYEGTTISVDDEMPADQRANKRYDISMWCEGYLPLPEKIVPSILGKVMAFKETDTNEVLQTMEGKLNVAQIEIPFQQT